MITCWEDSNTGYPRHSASIPEHFVYTSPNYNNSTVLKYAAIASFENNNNSNPYREYYKQVSKEYLD